MVAFIDFEVVFGYHLDKTHLKIKDGSVGAPSVNETIYADPKDRFEIIKIPKHEENSALLLVNDFSQGYSIFKVDEVQTCYVTQLDIDASKPFQLEESVREAKHSFPSSFTESQNTVIPIGPMDSATFMGRMAAKFCGLYQVLAADITKGEADLEAIKEKEMKELSEHLKQGGDAAEKEFAIACSEEEVEDTLTECPDKFERLDVTCKIQSRTSLYDIDCDSTGPPQPACSGNRHSTGFVCCDFHCPL